MRVTKSSSRKIRAPSPPSRTVIDLTGDDDPSVEESVGSTCGATQNTLLLLPYPAPAPVDDGRPSPASAPHGRSMSMVEEDMVEDMVVMEPFISLRLEARSGLKRVSYGPEGLPSPLYSDFGSNQDEDLKIYDW